MSEASSLAPAVQVPERWARWLRCLFAVLVPLTVVVWVVVALWARWRGRPRPAFAAALFPALLVLATAAVVPGDMPGSPEDLAHLVLAPAHDGLIGALGLVEPPEPDWSAHPPEHDPSTPEGRAAILANLSRWRGDREAQVATTGSLYSRRMVEVWLQRVAGSEIDAAATTPITSAELRAWWSSHPEAFERRWEYRVKAFRTLRDAEKFLSSTRMISNAVRFEHATAYSDSAFRAEDRANDWGDEWHRADNEVVRTLAVGAVSAPFLVDIGTDIRPGQAAHVVWLERFETAQDRPYNAEHVERVWRETQGRQIATTALETLTRGVVPLRSLEGTAPKSAPCISVLRRPVWDNLYSGRCTEVAPATYARAYAQAWRDPMIVKAAEVQQAFADELSSETWDRAHRASLNELHSGLRRARREARKATTALMLVATLLLGVLSLPAPALERVRAAESWVRRLPIVALAVWPVGGFVLERLLPLIEAPLHSLWARFDRDPVSEHLDELTSQAHEPITNEGPSHWVTWMDVRFGHVTSTEIGRDVQTVVIMLAFTLAFYIVGRSWRWHTRGVLGQYDGLNGRVTSITIVLASVGLAGAIGTVKLARETSAVRDEGYDPWWPVLVACVVVLVRLTLTDVDWWRRRTREHATGSAWIVGLGVGIAVFFAAWPWHRPILAAMQFSLLIAGLGMAGLRELGEWLLARAARRAPWKNDRQVNWDLINGTHAEIDDDSVQEAVPPGQAHRFLLRKDIAALLESDGPRESGSNRSSPQRAALLDAIAAHHLAAGTVPTGEWPDGRVPYFYNDPVSSTRLAQLDEKWRGLDR